MSIVGARGRLSDGTIAPHAKECGREFAGMRQGGATIRQRRAVLAALAATGVTLAAPIVALAQADAGTVTATTRGDDVAQTDPTTGYAPVNGLQISYETHGSGGTPLVLLHGGVVGSITFAPLLPALSASRQVITIDLQGHGHTRDIDRPLRNETMADDVAGVLAHLDIAQADLLGYSMGGGVALQTAFRHPEIVRKLIIVSATMRHDGSYPEVLAQLDQLEANAPHLGAQVAQSPLATVYPEADWETIFAKSGEMASQDYDWSADVAAITAPTMLIFADADSIRPEHMVEFYKLLGGGQRDADLDGSQRPASRLGILPGTTHYDILTFPGFPDIVTAFLDAPLPQGEDRP
jgi:pimeloyl-ACP methyl ester carboxylesterase